MHLAHRNRQGNVPVWMAQMSLHCTQNEARTPPCPIKSRQDSCQLRVEPAGHLPSHTERLRGPCTRGPPPSVCSSAQICSLRGGPAPIVRCLSCADLSRPCGDLPAQALSHAFFPHQNAFPSPNPRWICGGPPCRSSG